MSMLDYCINNPFICIGTNMLGFFPMVGAGIALFGIGTLVGVGIGYFRRAGPTAATADEDENPENEVFDEGPNNNNVQQPPNPHPQMAFNEEGD
ncbi:hypothetical protein niasHT_039024 [Heterodera trifolii]|uniref:Uncharacterized protein n=1 Tax=Heterodera trifolii TaxID=157864 RepID=A0ABD2J5W8_9BILA